MKALAQILINENANLPYNFNQTPTESPGRVVKLSYSSNRRAKNNINGRKKSGSTRPVLYICM